ncbi:hypothetical protein AB685_15320 [Bacillus sp. LL01]|nr:hypothetical protein AB685_15320 [Bacillus sp. LL01]
MRPRRAQPEEAQGRPAESAAFCGNQQRYKLDHKNNILFQWPPIVNRGLFLCLFETFYTVCPYLIIYKIQNTLFGGS